MKKALRFAACGTFLMLIGIQFFRSPPNLGIAEGPNSLVVRHGVRVEVQKVLHRACYDCHSQNTTYPWYAAVQPVAWWLGGHIAQGKASLNLSEFAAYDAKRAVRKIQAMADVVYERQMPPKSYLLLHPEAKLTDTEIVLVTKWAEGLADEIESR